MKVIFKSGIKTNIKEGGSVCDEESIKVADKYGLNMGFAGVKYFRH